MKVISRIFIIFVINVAFCVSMPLRAMDDQFEVVSRPCYWGYRLVACKKDAGSSLSKEGPEIGFIDYSIPRRDAATIDQLWVTPLKRGHGVAKGLMRCVLAQMERVGCTQVELYAAALEKTTEFPRLVRFYQQLGFFCVSDSMSDPVRMQKNFGTELMQATWESKVV